MKARVILNPSLCVRAMREMKTSSSLRLAMLILNPIQGVRSQIKREPQIFAASHPKNALHCINANQNNIAPQYINAFSQTRLALQAIYASPGRLESHFACAFWRLS